VRSYERRAVATGTPPEGAHQPGFCDLGDGTVCAAPRLAKLELLAARINAERRDLLEMIEGLYRRRVDADCRRNCLTAWHRGDRR
jgi:hypothetical protein